MLRFFFFFAIILVDQQYKYEPRDLHQQARQNTHSRVVHTQLFTGKCRQGTKSLILHFLTGLKLNIIVCDRETGYPTQKRQVGNGCICNFCLTSLEKARNTTRYKCISMNAYQGSHPGWYLQEGRWHFRIGQTCAFQWVWWEGRREARPLAGISIHGPPHVVYSQTHGPCRVGLQLARHLACVRTNKFTNLIKTPLCIFRGP